MTRFLILVVFLGQTSFARACGYCVEDKIASAYDHAVVTRALARKHHVVFFHIDGSVPAGDPAKRMLEYLVGSSEGVDRGSVRLSLDTATLSFAFDPARAPLASLQTGLEKKLARHNLALMPLRIMEEPADLKTVRR